MKARAAAVIFALGALPGPVLGAQIGPQPQLNGSIVYIRGGNVWLFVPSTGARRQVTSDGDYRSPSLADDGTIGAVQRIGGRSQPTPMSSSPRSAWVGSVVTNAGALAALDRFLP